MKKIFSYLAIAVGAIMLAACNPSEQLTPATSKTQLWPAGSNTSEYFGYINAKGEMVIKPQFNAANNFSCGLAAVRKNDSWYYINEKGETVSSPYNYAYDFRYNFAGVGNEFDHWYLINKSFEEVLPDYYAIGDMTADGLVFAQKKESSKYGYYDKNGKCVLDPIYEDAFNFIDGLARVFVGDACGVIDTKGEMVITPSTQFTYFPDSEKVIQVYDPSSGDYGLIDRNGNEIAPIMYDDVPWFFSEGLLVVEKNGKYGYIDNKGKEVIAFQYDNAYSFQNGVAWVKKNDVWSVIDTKGSTLFSVYDTILDDGNLYFTNDLSLVMIPKGNAYFENRYYNKKGEIVYSWTYEDEEHPIALSPRLSAKPHAIRR
ncbi:MAG: WG repeat-containing protein [Paludibacteraceae bacterium]|nr:WG repeat-containing protein [Paludibacteraceae bacterium]